MEKFSGKIDIFLELFSEFFLILIPIYCSQFSKTGRGCKKNFTRKNDFFGGGGLFGNWLYRGVCKKIFTCKN